MPVLCSGRVEPLTFLCSNLGLSVSDVRAHRAPAGSAAQSESCRKLVRKGVVPESSLFTSRNAVN